MTTYITPSPCDSCNHLTRIIKKTGQWACKAFPKGIPMIIYQEKDDHSKPLPNQGNNIVFERKRRIKNEI